jgi:hypothetical protein
LRCTLGVANELHAVESHEEAIVTAPFAIAFLGFGSATFGVLGALLIVMRL